MLSIHFYSFSFSHSILISSFLYQYSIFYYDYDIVDFKRNTIIEMKMDDMNRTQFPICDSIIQKSMFLIRCCWIHFYELMNVIFEYTNKNEIIRMKSDKINCVFISLVFLNDLLFHKNYLISQKIESYSFLWMNKE